MADQRNGGIAWTATWNPIRGSMSDLFHEKLTNEDIAAVFGVIAACSVENQATADERIPLLLDTPADVRWVSYEPALGPIDFGRWFPQPGDPYAYEKAGGRGTLAMALGKPVRGIDWIVVGGESGPNSRPFDIAWARSTIDQCQAAGVAVFVKQIGSRPYTHKGPLNVSDKKGGDPLQWPCDLRVRELPKGGL